MIVKNRSVDVSFSNTLNLHKLRLKVCKKWLAGRLKLSHSSLFTEQIRSAGKLTFNGLTHRPVKCSTSKLSNENKYWDL